MSLEKCPFCGFPVSYTEISIVPRDIAWKHCIQAVCMNCRAAGPVVEGTIDDEGIALAAWNRRA